MLNVVLLRGHDDEMMIRTLQLGMGWFPDPAGGLNRVYRGLIENLPNAGIETFGLVAGSTSVAEASEGSVEAFAPTAMALPRRLRAARSAARHSFVTHSVDMVASHFSLYTYPVIDLIENLPLVVHFHGPWALESRVEGSSRVSVRLKRHVELRTYRRAQHFIVLSEAFQNVLHEEFSVPIDQIDVIGGGVECREFDTGLSRMEARERLALPQDRPILLSVRRLAARMGLENLIEAVSKIKKYEPDVLLLVAGIGPRAQALSSQVESLGVSDNVRFLGFVPERDLAATYRAADVSVVPTISLEGFGLTVIESLAAGTPVVVTPVGGLPEIVRDLDSGLVLGDSTVRSLTDSLRDVVEGAIDLPTDEACQSFVRERYDWAAVAQSVSACYKEVLKA